MSLTGRGRVAKDRYGRRWRAVEQRSEDRFGVVVVGGLRDVLAAFAGHRTGGEPTLALGLRRLRTAGVPAAGIAPGPAPCSPTRGPRCRAIRWSCIAAGSPTAADSVRRAAGHGANRCRFRLAGDPPATSRKAASMGRVRLPGTPSAQRCWSPAVAPGNTVGTSMPLPGRAREHRWHIDAVARPCPGTPLAHRCRCPAVPGNTVGTSMPLPGRAQEHRWHIDAASATPECHRCRGNERPSSIDGATMRMRGDAARRDGVAGRIGRAGHGVARAGSGGRATGWRRPGEGGGGGVVVRVGAAASWRPVAAAPSFGFPLDGGTVQRSIVLGT